MTYGELAKFLEKYAHVQFLEHGFEYWSNNKSLDTQPLPGFNGEDGYRAPACFVRPGNCEGEVVEIRLLLKNDATKQIAMAKGFGDSMKYQEVARASAEVIDQFYGFGELPLIVDFAETLTDNVLGTFTLMDMAGKEIQFIHDEHKLDVVFDGKTKASYNFTDLGGNAKFAVEDYLKDWQRLAKNLSLVIVDQPSPKDEESETAGESIGMS